ncbi:hypothetical protein ACWGS9_29285 [Bradyrhizobium sp. Arg314]
MKGDYDALRDLFVDIIAEAVEMKVSETVAVTVEVVKAKKPSDPKKVSAGNILTTEGVTAAAIPPKLLEDVAGCCRHRGPDTDGQNPEGMV